MEGGYDASIFTIASTPLGSAALYLANKIERKSTLLAQSNEQIPMAGDACCALPGRKPLSFFQVAALRTGVTTLLHTRMYSWCAFRLGSIVRSMQTAIESV